MTSLLTADRLNQRGKTNRLCSWREVKKEQVKKPETLRSIQPSSEDKAANGPHADLDLLFFFGFWLLATRTKGHRPEGLNKIRKIPHDSEKSDKRKVQKMNIINVLVVWPSHS